MENVWLSGPVMGDGCYNYYTPTQHVLQGYSCSFFLQLSLGALGILFLLQLPCSLLFLFFFFFLIRNTNQVQPQVFTHHSLIIRDPGFHLYNPVLTRLSKSLFLQL